jgi:hypothetical protein
MSLFRLATSILFGLLLACLQACTTPSARTDTTVIDPVSVQPTPKPVIQGDTNEDLKNAYIRRGVAIDNCNTDKAAIAKGAK